MKVRDMKIGIVGAGSMGLGIAQVCAQAGFRVVMTDSSVSMYASVHRRLDKYLTKEELRRIVPSNSIRTFEDVDFVIEAVFEDLDVKREVFEKLDKICPSHAIFATNTSSIPIAQIAGVTNRERKFIGMHFMNPPARVPLLEIIATRETSKSTLRTTGALARLLKRNPVIVSKDRPGFVVNRILMAAINEAIRLVENGVASAEDVDASTIIGVGSSKGMPILQLADLIGLDVLKNVLVVLYKDYGSYVPGRLLLDLVANGHLGKKTGRGFFTYESGVLIAPKEDTQNYHNMPGGE